MDFLSSGVKGLSLSTRAPGRLSACHLNDFLQTWQVEWVLSKTQKAQDRPPPIVFWGKIDNFHQNIWQELTAVLSKEFIQFDFPLEPILLYYSDVYHIIFEWLVGIQTAMIRCGTGHMTFFGSLEIDHFLCKISPTIRSKFPEIETQNVVSRLAVCRVMCVWLQMQWCLLAKGWQQRELGRNPRWILLCRAVWFLRRFDFSSCSFDNQCV